MSLKETIHQELVEAMKSGNDLKKSALRFLKSKVTEAEKVAGNLELKEEEILKIISTSVKQRTDSIKQFSDAGRHDLVEKEKEELSHIEKFLPSKLSPEVLKEKILEILKDVEVSNVAKVTGQTVGALNKAFPGQIDIDEAKKILADLFTQK